MLHHIATGSLRGLVRQLSIDQFENESRRVSCDSSKALPPPGGSTPEGSQPDGTPMFERAVSPGVCVELQHTEDGRYRLPTQRAGQVRWRYMKSECDAFHRYQRQQCTDSCCGSC